MVTFSLPPSDHLPYPLPLFPLSSGTLVGVLPEDKRDTDTRLVQKEALSHPLGRLANEAYAPRAHLLDLPHRVVRPTSAAAVVSSAADVLVCRAVVVAGVVLGDVVTHLFFFPLFPFLWFPVSVLRGVGMRSG